MKTFIYTLAFSALVTGLLTETAYCEGLKDMDKTNIRSVEGGGARRSLQSGNEDADQLAKLQEPLARNAHTQPKDLSDSEAGELRLYNDKGEGFGNAVEQPLNADLNKLKTTHPLVSYALDGGHTPAAPKAGGGTTETPMQKQFQTYQDNLQTTWKTAYDTLTKPYADFFEKARGLMKPGVKKSEFQSELAKLEDQYHGAADALQKANKLNGYLGKAALSLANNRGTTLDNLNKAYANALNGLEKDIASLT